MLAIGFSSHGVRIRKVDLADGLLPVTGSRGWGAHGL